MNNIKSIYQDIINKTDRDLVNIFFLEVENTTTTLIQKYSDF